MFPLSSCLVSALIMPPPVRLATEAVINRADTARWPQRSPAKTKALARAYCFDLSLLLGFFWQPVWTCSPPAMRKQRSREGYKDIKQERVCMSWVELSAGGHPQHMDTAWLNLRQASALSRCLIFMIWKTDQTVWPFLVNARNLGLTFQKVVLQRAVMMGLCG